MSASFQQLAFKHIFLGISPDADHCLQSSQDAKSGKKSRLPC